MSQLSEPDGADHPTAPATASLAPDAGTVGAAPTPRRLLIAIVVGAAVAGLGGLILGEYPFTGVMPYIAGILFALVVAEVMLSIGRQPGAATAAAAAVCSAGGLGWAVWISSGRGVAPVPIGGWVAIVIGAAVGLARGGIRTAARPGRSSPHRS